MAARYVMGIFGGLGTPKALIGHGADEPAAHAIGAGAPELGSTTLDSAHSRRGRAEDPPPDSMRAQRPEMAAPLTEATFDALDRLSGHARTRGVSSAALALAWVAHTGPNIRLLVGPRRPDHLDAVAESLTVDLTAGGELSDGVGQP
jgi:hypothetical protein